MTIQPEDARAAITGDLVGMRVQVPRMGLTGSFTNVDIRGDGTFKASIVTTSYASYEVEVKRPLLEQLIQSSTSSTEFASNLEATLEVPGTMRSFVVIRGLPGEPAGTLPDPDEPPPPTRGGA